MGVSLSRALPNAYPVSWPAIINNPLRDVAYTNEPVAIRVFFFQGECGAATWLKVKNPAGNYVDFQWEPAAHPRREGDMGTWPDGSLKHGTLWVVVPSLRADETQRWTVELYSGAQAYSPVQNVVHAVVDASNETFQTSSVTLNFKDSSAWMPQSMIDRATNGEMLATATGLTVRIKFTAAGGELLSSTAINITGLAKQRLGTSNTGYGVAYQEFEASWTWAAASVTTRVRTRLWANGRVTIESYTITNGSAASDGKSLILNISANNTSIITNTGDNEKGRKLWEYADRRFICGFKYLTTDYEGKTTETHSTNWSTSIAANRMFGGWIGTTSYPASAYWFQACFLSLYAAGGEEAEWLRGMNPVATTAARWKPGHARAYIKDFVRRYIEAWLPNSTDADKKGLEGGMRILLGTLSGSGYSAATALTKFEEYCTGAGITSSSATSWHTAWNAGQGMNFIGKNSEALPYIIARAVASGDTASAATARTIMRAVADFVVQAEVTSGGSGQMKLDGTGLDNYNAESTAMGLLAQAIVEFGDNGSWAACYRRIANRYVQGDFAGGTRRCYRLQTYGGLPHDCVKAPQSTYDSYQNYELSRALAMVPLDASVLREPDMRQYLYEITQAAFLPEDRKYQGQVVRRGLTNTTMHWIFTLARLGNESDWCAAALIARNADATLQPKVGQQHPQYGFVGTDVTMLNVMGDVRAAAEVLRLGIGV